MSECISNFIDATLKIVHAIRFGVPQKAVGMRQVAF